jgi:hypothetical protein
MPSRRLRTVCCLSGVSVAPNLTRGYEIAVFDSPSVTVFHVSVTLFPSVAGVLFSSAVVLNDRLPNGQPAYSSVLPDLTVDGAGVFYPTPARLSCFGLTTFYSPSYHSSISVSGDNHSFLQLLVTANQPNVRFFAILDFSFSS